MSVSATDIQLALTRIQHAVIKTPLLESAELNRRTAARVFVKPESLQHIGAFKFRGAYNRLVQFNDEQKRAGVVAFSSGNHAQGIAYAAQLLGLQATIVMPSDAPKIKLSGTKRLGARIVEYDRHTESREQIAADIAADSGAVLVPAFEDVDIIAGQGTCGLEINSQLTEMGLQADIVMTPCGGGGLLAGVSTAMRSVAPLCQIFGVEPQQYNDHFLSQQAGERIDIGSSGASFCDALMAPTPGELTWSINSKTVDGFLCVSEEQVAHAISFAFRFLKLVVEPGAAVALAALLNQDSIDATCPVEFSGKNVAIVVSGGNIDPATLTQCLEAHPSP